MLFSFDLAVTTGELATSTLEFKVVVNHVEHDWATEEALIANDRVDFKQTLANSSGLLRCCAFGNQTIIKVFILALIVC